MINCAKTNHIHCTCMCAPQWALFKVIVDLNRKLRQIFWGGGGGGGGGYKADICAWALLLKTMVMMWAGSILVGNGYQNYKLEHSKELTQYTSA